MEEIKNPILEQKEKKDLRLKIKMPVDLKRWFSKKLDKIVSNFRQNNSVLANSNVDKKLDITNMKANDVVNAITYQVKESLVKRADIYKVSKEYEIQDIYERENENLEILYSNKQISDKEYAKKLEDIEYKRQKANYAHNIGEPTERPKNPKVQRAIQTAKKVGKIAAGIGVAGVGLAGIGGIIGIVGGIGATGVGIGAAGAGVGAAGAGVTSLTTSLSGIIQLVGAIGIGGAAVGATGFGAIKLGKFIAQKAPLMLNEAKIIGKTAGKTIEEVGKSVSDKVSPMLEESKKEVARDSAKKEIRKTKDLGARAEKLEVKDEQFEGLYEEIISEDYKAAIKENAKRGFSLISEEERQEIHDVRSYKDLDDRKEAFEVASDKSQQIIMEQDYLDAVNEDNYRTLIEEVQNKKMQQENATRKLDEIESLDGKKEYLEKEVKDKEIQEMIMDKDYDRAIKEDRARARREKLHMEGKPIEINHKTAIEKVEGEIVSPEEVKEAGDMSK